MPLDKNSFYARTMHTPDTPERASLRAALRDVSKALLPLHRALIDAAKDDYAFGIAPVKPPQLLQLLNDDPFFAWLKPLTSLIVDIDEMARTDFEPADVAAIADRFRCFSDGDQLGVPEGIAGFAAIAAASDDDTIAIDDDCAHWNLARRAGFFGQRERFAHPVRFVHSFKDYNGGLIARRRIVA